MALPFLADPTRQWQEKETKAQIHKGHNSVRPEPQMSAPSCPYDPGLGSSLLLDPLPLILWLQLTPSIVLLTLQVPLGEAYPQSSQPQRKQANEFPPRPADHPQGEYPPDKTGKEEHGEDWGKVPWLVGCSLSRWSLTDPSLPPLDSRT